jgi:hypothetical protein
MYYITFMLYGRAILLRTEQSNTRPRGPQRVVIGPDRGFIGE